jgi:hypothetical protein
MRIFSKLPSKLDRGLNWRRLQVLFRKPAVLIRNARFLFTSSTSEEEHIFVVGPPRSGTTLVKNILRGHPRIASIDDESFFFFRRNYYDFELSGIPEKKMETLVQRSRDSVHLFDLIAQRVKEASGAERFLEKTASHALRTGFLLEHFPRSKVVFTLRDVRDGFLSARRNPAYWSSLDSSDPLRSYAENWRECAKKGLEHRMHERVRLLRYEDLCEEPDPQIQATMQFLGLSYEATQLHPTSYSQTEVSNQQGHERLKRSISSETVSQWKTRMDPGTEARLCKIAGRELHALGYPTSVLQNEHSP